MIDPNAVDWDKMDGLVPAIVQDRQGLVRMLGYLNRAALQTTLDSGFVTFFSRSKRRLWMKGESSGNRLALVAIRADCDRDALLITADAKGPTCHAGEASCFGVTEGQFFPAGLESVVAARAGDDPDHSYTARLFNQGVKRIAQKVGEEGVETALAATSGDGDELVAEAADLAFHLTVLLRACGKSWADIGHELERRHSERIATASS
jgi:phosphoribosyl-ATP pyrophosphohydrolase/phosphoribosyl-AMP cyclohydrolase